MTVRRAVRWPIVACALVALASATAAFIESPAARHPAVEPHASAIRVRAVRATELVDHLAREVLAR